MSVLAELVVVYRALRLNYTRRGVYHWLVGRHRDGERGWRKVLREADRRRVHAEQHAIAEGVFL